jgi:hypothetical protein
MNTKYKILQIIKEHKHSSTDSKFSSYTPTSIKISDSELFLCVIDYKKDVGYFIKENEILNLIDDFLGHISKRNVNPNDSSKMDLLASQFYLWLSLIYKNELIKCLPHPITKNY